MELYTKNQNVLIKKNYKKLKTKQYSKHFFNKNIGKNGKIL